MFAIFIIYQGINKAICLVDTVIDAIVMCIRLQEYQPDAEFVFMELREA